MFSQQKGQIKLNDLEKLVLLNQPTKLFVPHCRRYQLGVYIGDQTQNLEYQNSLDRVLLLNSWIYQVRLVGRHNLFVMSFTRQGQYLKFQGTLLQSQQHIPSYKKYPLIHYKQILSLSQIQQGELHAWHVQQGLDQQLNYLAKYCELKGQRHLPLTKMRSLVQDKQSETFGPLHVKHEQ
ncbi:hypothetical protein TTHERM_000189048 (macronuclear) [Tetrahymena thermophila SB210]|uniref:Uncharacterized protein n=1 Tax=Tetrahymena thermophila (strain SB210) TaxID=312017 RepID=W7XA69_TETTS|nr:hypothetical protein TTHERM_000189048 [Tetrahymena thermophila SB210]EWS74237.1 hypothetical protein TTHERM_000189048 [Tetrahymena thermophila SB210]|eukprot:XP_012653210.1 hypothetical protein TTHERM_000189048 [Tetrahymena thermophila SB210]